MVLSPCIDTIATIQQLPLPPHSTNTHQWTYSDKENGNREGTETVQHSSWQVEICSSLYASPEAMENEPTVVEYAVIENNSALDYEKEIRWRAAEASKRAAGVGV